MPKVLIMGPHVRNLSAGLTVRYHHQKMIVCGGSCLLTLESRWYHACLKLVLDNLRIIEEAIRLNPVM